MNNFDTSSRGVNLELSAFYDNDLSRNWFDENFSPVENMTTQYGGNEVYLFTDNGQSPDFDPADIKYYSFSKKDLLNALKEYNDNDLQALKDSFLSFSGVYLCNATKQDLTEYIDHVLYYDSSKVEFYQEYLTPLYDVITIRGYCQGDYAEVVILPEVKNDFKKGFDFGQYFTNLFYSSPVYARLTIDSDNECYLEEYLKDSYQWNKDQVLEGVKTHLTHEKKEYILNWLDENLPTTPDYL